jgi:hypothetical protein
MTALITAVIPVLFKQEPTMPAEIKQNYDAQKERVKRLLEKKN